MQNLSTATPRKSCISGLPMEPGVISSHLRLSWYLTTHTLIGKSTSRKLIRLCQKLVKKQEGGRETGIKTEIVEAKPTTLQKKVTVGHWDLIDSILGDLLATKTGFLLNKLNSIWPN